MGDDDICLPDCIGQEPSGVHAPLKEGVEGTRGTQAVQDLTKCLH